MTVLKEREREREKRKWGIYMQVLYEHQRMRQMNPFKRDIILNGVHSPLLNGVNTRDDRRGG